MKILIVILFSLVMLPAMSFVFHETLKTPCGLQGSLDERIKDCSTGSDSAKEGFVLVTRTKLMKEVYKELSSDILWSDRLPTTALNHHHAKILCKELMAELTGIENLKWELPSIKVYKNAIKSGIINALPNMNYWFWSSTHRSFYKSEYRAWIISGVSDYLNSDYQYSLNISVRCISKINENFNE